MNKINNKINQGSLLVGVVFVLKRSAAQYYLTPHAFDIYPICARKCNNSFEFEFTFSYAIYSKKNTNTDRHAVQSRTKPNERKTSTFFSKQKLPPHILMIAIASNDEKLRHHRIHSNLVNCIPFKLNNKHQTKQTDESGSNVNNDFKTILPTNGIELVAVKVIIPR